MTKSFTVRDFNKNVNATLKNATIKQKANMRCYMLLKCLKYQVKGGVK